MYHFCFERNYSRINMANNILVSRFSLMLGWPVFINLFFVILLKLSVFNSSCLSRPSPLRRFPSEDFVSGSIFLFVSYPALPLKKRFAQVFSSFFKACVLNLSRLITFYYISTFHLWYHNLTVIISLCCKSPPPLPPHLPSSPS